MFNELAYAIDGLKRAIVVLTILSCCLILIIFLSIFVGRSRSKEITALKTEAVRRGAATWIVDADGNSTFTWKP